MSYNKFEKSILRLVIYFSFFVSIIMMIYLLVMIGYYCGSAYPKIPVLHSLKYIVTYRYVEILIPFSLLLLLGIAGFYFLKEYKKDMSTPKPPKRTHKRTKK